MKKYKYISSLNNEKGGLIMEASNSFSKVKDFKEIVTNPNTINIFLNIAQGERITDEKLVKITKLEPNEVDHHLNILEKSTFIERNPGKASRKFKLAFNGQLFAESLKKTYPEVNRLLGKETLIETLQTSRK